MAIYHCSIQVIGRNSGRSAVAAAAYRSGECLKSEYDGEERDYTKKNWVEYNEIILPKNAPREYMDRNTLWNAVEMSEKSKDAQLCREFELSLPVEMNKAEQIDVIHSFVNESLVSQGMIVDIAIHNPPVTNDRHQPIDEFGNVTSDTSKMQFINPHVHIMATLRPMDENGKWQKKSETEYLCKKDGEEKPFTASEYKTVKEQGWEKQYKYYYNNKKIWITPSEAKKDELERVNRTPKTSPYGRKNSVIEKWNSKEQLLKWRKDWEDVVNKKFEKMGLDIRIDSSSFKDQGRLEEIPTIHMGPSATNMEKRAKRELSEGKTESEVRRSDIGLINEEIKKHNSFVREFLCKVVDIAKKSIEEIAKKLESIRFALIKHKIKEEEVVRRDRALLYVLDPERERLENYKNCIDSINSSNTISEKLISEYRDALNKCKPYQIKKKDELLNNIAIEEKKISDRNEYLLSLNKKYNIADLDEYSHIIKEYEDKYLEHVDNHKEKEKLDLEINTLIQDYKINEEMITPQDKEKIERIRKTLRPLYNAKIEEEFKNINQNIRLQISNVDRIIGNENKEDVQAKKKIK